MIKKSLILISFALVLAACSSREKLIETNSSFVNIEADLAPLIKVNTKKDYFSIKNKTKNTIDLAYNLTWYDKTGVTQITDIQNDEIQWHQLTVEPKQAGKVKTPKPTPESQNYRLYMRLNHID